MNSRELRQQDSEGASQTSDEVQFALVIARMIETVKADPEVMRQAVYDLARHKLQEQLVGSSPADIQTAERALESAIHGVEEFSRQDLHLPAPPPVPQLGSASPPRKIGSVPSGSRSELWRAVEMARRAPLWPVVTRTGLVLLIVGLIGGAWIAVQQREPLALPQAAQGKMAPPPLQKAVTSPPAPVDKKPPMPPAFPLPTDYGVYALSDNALTEMQLLPGRPPDARVAISAAFRLPGKAELPNGHPEFVVFRRDAATNIPERVEVRVIARIARDFSAESAGKRPDDGDAWVIRNLSYPYRASPVPDNPEMYRLHSEDPTVQLPAGRYALILKNQAYYFSVGGEITDPRQCIERVVATNGTFYSACKKP
ncbi:hypothetical protein JQ615_17205 [Bradyrhizobium jicamae]|uniref:Uncharacterized protein n=2 Tax=Bradyrhizobium jicamae TaxID=280332 RepID=A0ABS5FK16_9BRAD|nr:hypothetical protein [Bradyrhizobium jicamae]